MYGVIASTVLTTVLTPYTAMVPTPSATANKVPHPVNINAATKQSVIFISHFSMLI
jgi:hypothetical protein